MEYDFFDLHKFEFVDERYEKAGFFGKLLHLYLSLPLPWAGIGQSPVAQKEEYRKNGYHEFFPRLLSAIGFKDEAMIDVLAFHKRRIKTMRRIRFFAGLILYISIVVLIVTLLVFLDPGKENYSPVGISVSAIGARSLFWGILGLVLFAPSFLVAFIVVKTIRRVTTALTIRKYADTLCILTSAFIVVELSRETVLSNSDQRAMLLERINDLSKSTLFLGRRFASKSLREQEWSAEHFRYLERFIRERERWVIAPVETTASDLRRDFYKLTRMYLSGNYGEFNWKTVSMPPAVSPSLRESLTPVLLRSLGIVLPLIFLGLLLWRRSDLEVIGIGSNLIALIFVSWFLLAVDAVLKLGIVAGIVNLAKEIKSLK